MSDREPRRDPLREAVEALPREIAPGRDLWPGISARLGPQERERQPGAALPFPELVGRLTRRARGARPSAGRVLGAAACLAAAAAVLLILSAPPEPDVGRESWQHQAQAALEQDYTLVRDAVADILAVHCDTPPAAGCDDLRAGLDELERSVRELMLAIAAEPAGSTGARWLLQQLQRTLNQAGGLSRLAGSIL